MARNTASVVHLEDFREISQREAQWECSLHEPNTVNRVPAIDAIAGSGAW
jgi:hypothetical protein